MHDQRSRPSEVGLELVVSVVNQIDRFAEAVN